MDANSNTDELESFRRQWKEEVSARNKGQQSRPKSPKPAVASVETQVPAREPPRYAVSNFRGQDEEDAGTGSETASAAHGQGELTDQMRSLGISSADDDVFRPEPKAQPSSALEHFEEAVRKEAQGSLGASLDHYRKAYKLDFKVDQKYRSKHFPAPVYHPASSTPLNAPSTAGSASHQSNDESHIPTPELIASFAGHSIPVADPIIENTPPPPCPISKMPSEVILCILHQVIILDPAAFGRLSLVCKRLAYHIAYEQHLWRRLCQGAEYGFAAMHYTFACDVQGNRIYSFIPRYTPFPRNSPALEIPKPLSNWSEVFQCFPRIRFTGIYISTVNYSRPGAASALQSTSWNAPIHIVTYYRYLRFYPDGTVISLLTTTEPVDVVPHISKENLETISNPVPAHRRHLAEPGAASQPVANPIPPTAAAALKSSLRGRWHLKNPSPVDPSPEDLEAPAQILSQPIPPASKLRPSSTNPDSTPDPRDLFIETEGVDPKYIYTMHLSLRSPATSSRTTTSNPSRNTKLAWKAFWSYNKLTDDWAEFGLRNDRAFVFRRVRGWGMS